MASHHISCDGCSEFVTIHNGEWYGNCQKEGCAKVVLAPITSGMRYIRFLDDRDKMYTYKRVTVESAIVEFDGLLYVISPEIARICNMQIVYLAILAPEILKTSLEQLGEARREIGELKEGKERDAAEKEELRRQLKVVTEEKDFLGERVTDLTNQLEVNTQSLDEKTVELQEATKKLSAFRLDSEEQMKQLQKTFEDEKDSIQEELKKVNHAMNKCQRKLEKKSKKMEQTKKEASEAIQELKDDKKWLKKLAMNLSSSKGTTDNEAKECSFCDKKKADEMKEKGNEEKEEMKEIDDLDWDESGSNLGDEDKTSSEVETEVINLLLSQTETDGMKGEEKKENEVEESYCKMTETIGLEDDEVVEDSSV